MAILTLLLGVLLLGCGFGGLVLSLDLIPTERGLLYAVSGVIFLCAAAVVMSIAALIARLDKIVAPPKKPAAATPTPAPALEAVVAEPEAPPQVVGRYTAGGANYVIFSDGGIEAETNAGALRFASMSEFKSYIAGRQG